MMIWSGTSFFALWFAIGALLLAGAWIAHSGWWSLSPSPLRYAIVVVVCAALGICVVTQGAALGSFDSKGEPDLNCIIVLGAQVRDDGPSTVLRYRLDEARDYLIANPRTRCIVSGGQGANEPVAEAEVMARYLVEQGIDPARITKESASLNTVGNIRNCMQLIDPAVDRVGIVTNDFHMFRGVSIARKQGIQNVCGIAAYSDPRYLPNNLLRETFGISKDFVQGNL